MKKKRPTSKRAKPSRAPTSNHPILKKVLDEVHQSPSIRQDLIAGIEDKMGNKAVLTFFTSFRQPAVIDNTDADMIEGILQKLDPQEGLVLIINSAGGDALAAERIVNTCRHYSGGNFEVIVPKMAKSAATMICFGANCIHMSNTAELGPIDPQISVQEDGEWKSFSVYSIVSSYRRLLMEAVSTKGRIEPYLQQLSIYDPRQIKHLEMVQALAEDIAIRLLKTGMMKGVSKTKIRRNIKAFLDPSRMQVHGRPIYMDDLASSKFVVKKIALDSDLWEYILELYVRSAQLLNKENRKMTETRTVAYSL